MKRTRITTILLVMILLISVCSVSIHAADDAELTYPRAETLSDGYIVLSVAPDDMYIGLSRGSMKIGSNTLNEGGSVTATHDSTLQIRQDENENGFLIFAYDSPDETDADRRYLNLTSDGGAFSSKSVGLWNCTSDSTLYFTDTTEAIYYIKSVDSSSVSVTADKSEAADVSFFIGDTKPAPPPPPGQKETVDKDAPVFTVQPGTVHYVLEGSDYAAPTYTVTATLPEGSTADGMTLRWFVNGSAYGDEKSFEGTSASDSITVNEFVGMTSGVYPVYCEACCTVDDTEHKAASFTTNFIVCKGVLTNSVLTFSDVHEKWNSIGQAVADTIKTENGLIPALVIATGDYNNGYVAGYRDDYINKCIETMIDRIGAQLGGIDTVWVSGNHDNGYATGFTNANKKADLGLDEANYYDVANGMSGTGIIFNSRSAPSAESSLYSQKLIVIGVNYEDIGALGAYADPDTDNGRPSDASLLDYGTADSPANTVYHYLDTALKNTAVNYNGELVIISTHAGLHMLGVDPDSECRADSKGDYSIRNSAALVKLINSYADAYNMNILFLFGHDHSRGEREFYKLPGDTIYATVDPTTSAYEELRLSFGYGHAGYITSSIGGNQVYSLITYDNENVTRRARVSDGSITPITELTDEEGNRLYPETLDFTYALYHSDVEPIPPDTEPETQTEKQPDTEHEEQTEIQPDSETEAQTEKKPEAETQTLPETTDPVSPTEQTNARPEKNAPVADSSYGAVNTGDSDNIVLFLVVLILSFAIIVMLRRSYIR